MPATSLSEQLKRLSLPQSKIYRDDDKKLSLLFDPKEAASKDRETFYEIGLSGLKELIALNEGYCFYQDTLFSLSSKDFERAVQSKEVNDNLDQNIKKFLLQLSPYLLLQSSHKALEWLVNRYHIHQYNQDAIMALILPYHESKIFVRFLQLLDISHSSNRWNWLRPIQKRRIPLTKQVLFNQCVSNPATLQFIAKTTMEYVIEFGERSSQLNTVFAFFCSAALGTINSNKSVNEAILNALLPALLKGLESPVVGYRSSACMVLGFLFTRANLKKKTLNAIMDKLLYTDFDLTYDTVLMINIIYSHQSHMTKIPKSILCNLSADLMYRISGHLKRLVANKNAYKFLNAFIYSTLRLVQSCEFEEIPRFSQLLEILIDEVDLKNQQPDKIIKTILYSYKPNKDNTQDDESDIEIIEHNSNEGILQWYSSFLKSVEQKYPEVFDKVIEEVVSSKDISSKQKMPLLKLLVFKPSIAHTVNGAYLFEKLNHTNPRLRIEAVNYMIKEFEKLKKENSDFVKDSIINRFYDDNLQVVETLLSIPNDKLNDLLTEDDVVKILCHIDSLKSEEAKGLCVKAIKKFSALDTLPATQEVLLIVLPYLFLMNDKLSATIFQSPWGKKLGVLIRFQGVKDSESCNKKLFQAIFECENFGLKNILDLKKLNRRNYTYVYLFLLLNVCQSRKAGVDEIMDFLDLIIETVEHCQIISLENKASFNLETLQTFFELSYGNEIVFEVLDYIFSKIIDNMPVTNIPKPWCNVFESRETLLVKRLFEIFVTGCSIRNYQEKYSALLAKLLNRFFTNAQGNIEFICNMAFGHVLYSTTSQDVITPELQLRTLKIIDNFIDINEDSWILESDVFILMLIFNLNYPIDLVREYVIGVITKIVDKYTNKSNIYYLLLKEILSHKEEILMDSERVKQILNTILTQHQSLKLKKTCVQRFLDILTSTPTFVSCNLSMILSHVNNPNFFASSLNALKPLEKVLQQNNTDSTFTFNIYDSKLFSHIYSRINKVTVSTFSKDQVWDSIEFGMRQYKECILMDDQTLISPSVLIMKQFDDDTFRKVPEEKRQILINLISSASVFSNNSTISSISAKVIRKIHLKFTDFKPILEAMLNVDDPAAETGKKKKSTITMYSHQIIDTKEWKLGVTVLEYVQTKKLMSVDNSYASILFQLLKKCLRFEEQSYCEYTKQLILSALWYYCKKFVNDKDEDQVRALKTMFDIKLVVQCIRGTQNPQTHHHSLILLSHAAYMLPEDVLQHTMEIFTFMGSSVLRHDDAYSFQIITKIIETLVPILVHLDKDIEEYSYAELQILQNRVVPVLRIFAGVVLHVPEHRRLPLYKKLIDTLGPRQFLWVFIALLLELHVENFSKTKEKSRNQKRTLADQESPISRLDFGQSILLEFPPEIVLESFIKLMAHLKSLPQQKDENAMDTSLNPSEIFSINAHTALQLRHYKYVIITFLNSCLSSTMYIEHNKQATDTKSMECYYEEFIVKILSFIENMIKIKDEKTAKYWKVMLHHSYDLLDHTNSLLSTSMFLNVTIGLIKHPLQAVRRKAMELLNSKVQFSPEMFDEKDKGSLLTLLPPLLAIVKTINSNTDEEESMIQELEMNQQTSLLSLKLLARMLAANNPDAFKPVLEIITAYVCHNDLSDNVMASVVLCLAELCANLKAHSLSSLRKFMPALIKVLKKQRKKETSELVLLSTVTALSKIIESLPLFLSPYLQKILYEQAILTAKWEIQDGENNKTSAILSKLHHIKKKTATSIPPRVLIPVANATYNALLEKEYYDSVGAVMSVLAESFANITTADFAALQKELTAFFISALELRSDATEKGVDDAVIDKSEGMVVDALVCLVLKLSESSFRPFYFKLYDWAIRTNVEGKKDRVITFYRLSSAIADKLKGLFVLFAGHFVKNAAELLDKCNISKTEHLFFDSHNKCIMLTKHIIKTLNIVFLYDNHNFITKERFETLMQPVVDNLENTLGGVENLKERATEVLIPCISQFAVAIADDSLWKLLNYQVLLKTRHNDPEIRLIAVECLVCMATQLGSSWLPLLAESVPFLAELLEDGDQRIETSTKDAIRKLEQILGEPLEKYF